MPATPVGAYLPAATTGFLLGASLIAAIGAQNLFVLRQGLQREHVALVVLLCAGIDIGLMTAGVAGMGAAVGAHPRALSAAAFAGAAFLGWYGWAAARRALRNQSMQAAAGRATASWRRIVGQTLAITLLNPHVYLDTVLLVGAVGAQQPAALRPAFLFGAGTASAAWFSGVGFGARLLTPVFADRRAWRVLDAVVALTMWGMALVLVRTGLAGMP